VRRTPLQTPFAKWRRQSEVATGSLANCKGPAGNVLSCYGARHPITHSASFDSHPFTATTLHHHSPSFTTHPPHRPTPIMSAPTHSATMTSVYSPHFAARNLALNISSLPYLDIQHSPIGGQCAFFSRQIPSPPCHTQHLTLPQCLTPANRASHHCLFFGYLSFYAALSRWVVGHVQRGAGNDNLSSFSPR
jgi:hypothetical protein